MQIRSIKTLLSTVSGCYAACLDFGNFAVCHENVSFDYLKLVTKPFRSAVSNTSAAIFYVFKCLYLIVSAWQIRNGYPRLCIGNLLTHSYGLANYVLFMIYFNVPLLFEIRTIVDWTYTETVMPIFDFLKMENIYAQIFMVKCSRVLDEVKSLSKYSIKTNFQTFPVQRGTLKPIFIKYPLGILIVIIIIGLALSPLIAYSIINRVGVQTGVHQVDLTISLQGYSVTFMLSFSIKHLFSLFTK